jgi:hypothetical protein
MDLGSTTVEVTSEDPLHPIESALVADGVSGTGWRAAVPGQQLIRILFDEPTRITRIELRFEEATVARSQEFVLAWSGDKEQALCEIVRQQWNFSPDGATTEVEDYRVQLEAVTVLQLAIDPDVGRGAVVASLARLRLA